MMRPHAGGLHIKLSLYARLGSRHRHHNTNAPNDQCVEGVRLVRRGQPYCISLPLTA